MSKPKFRTAERDDEEDLIGPAKATMGHNSEVNAEWLMQSIERIENLTDERGGIQSDITDEYALLKSRGYEPKIVRQIIKERRMDRQKREEQEELLDLYRHAVGLI